MSSEQASEVQLPDLSKDQKDWVVDARACGMTYPEIAEDFPDMYPGYATDIPRETLVKALEPRLKEIFHATSPESARYYLALKKDLELPINIEAIPIVQPHVRLLALHRLFKQKDPSPDLIRAQLAILGSNVSKEVEKLGLENPKKYNSGASKVNAQNLLGGDVGGALGEDDTEADDTDVDQEQTR